MVNDIDVPTSEWGPVGAFLVPDSAGDAYANELIHRATAAEPVLVPEEYRDREVFGDPADYPKGPKRPEPKVYRYRSDDELVELFTAGLQQRWRRQSIADHGANMNELQLWNANFWQHTPVVLTEAEPGDAPDLFGRLFDAVTAAVKVEFETRDSREGARGLAYPVFVFASEKDGAQLDADLRQARAPLTESYPGREEIDFYGRTFRAGIRPIRMGGSGAAGRLPAPQLLAHDAVNSVFSGIDAKHDFPAIVEAMQDRPEDVRESYARHVLDEIASGVEIGDQRRATKVVVAHVDDSLPAFDKLKILAAGTTTVHRYARSLALVVRNGGTIDPHANRTAADPSRQFLGTSLDGISRTRPTYEETNVTPDNIMLMPQYVQSPGELTTVAMMATRGSIAGDQQAFREARAAARQASRIRPG